MTHGSISRHKFLQMTAMSLTVTPFDWREMNALAAMGKPSKGKPVVIIGAGLGGLCCGAYMAKAGIQVTVVEQHFIPGGYATTFQRGKGIFTFLKCLWKARPSTTTLPSGCSGNLGYWTRSSLCPSRKS